VHRITLLAAIGGTLALAAAGCGGSDDNGKSGNGGEQAASSQMAPPKVKEPLSVTVPAFNKAIASQSCQAYAPYALTFTRPAAAQPGAAALVKDECANYKALLAKNLKNVKFNQARMYGTVALAQGPGPRMGKWTNHTALFVLDWDGKYRFYSTNASDPQIGSSPKSVTEFENTANAYVNAIRDKDCAAFQRYSYPNAGPNLGLAPAKACQAVFTGKNLAPQLRAEPKARVMLMGATLDWGFFAVATKKNYYTFLVTTHPAEAGAEWKGKAKTVVLDYFPNYTPAA